MQFEPIYQNGKLLLPKFELQMNPNESTGIITDLKRKQLVINQLSDRSRYFVLRAGQNEYLHLTVAELITFLLQVTERKDRLDPLMDYLALNEVRKVKVKKLPPSKRMYVTLLRAFFAYQPTIVLEEPYFYLEEEDRRHLKRILEDLSQEKSILILTSNLEDAMISCDEIYRLNEFGFHPLDIRDSGEDKQGIKEHDSPNITLQKISTKRNEKVILFDPPEVDYIESLDGSILVHVDGENYVCVSTLTDLELRLTHFGFFRCHRSYLVNLQKVREIITWTKNSYSLRLNTGKDAVVPLSRSKLQELKALLHI
ncbi:MAG: LytTR family transcriptional regulator DNA-binding domain-containing protein [Paenibacillus sp.]|uniref:LytTR family transcriptional regulator DNA-binding domain-containing protein n=1 Tax=Paenibacillus sp. TaxID=58172 RepID=UPI00290FA888|nr:LytTR family transcriptional regulator DNA-binding domain-containing protein [Paenibacillus sp.]MDU4694624.1 LytTR family transcriptional regulator DNA-binding domain-containing protein [Paenibacillus sp.]